ncbi:glycosyltransferase, partial [Pseudomonas sp. 2995-3]|uniref:glycosyltransferase n=1 Tax=Pseudomonas sp. 2995-3 TaxID=1712680 RepID=UPI00117B9AED
MEENERIPKLNIEHSLMKKRVHGYAATWQGIVDRDLKKVKNNGALINVIPNGVEKIKVNKVKNERGELTLLLVGRLSYQKGIDILLEGISLLPDMSKSKIKLNIVGEGELREELSLQVKELNIEGVVTFE